jgi:uncharacterized membrane protein YkvA (DUF1232 family)
MTNKAKAVVVVALTLIYIVSPIDFVPDFLPGIGQLDDLAALLYGGKKTIGLLMRA